MMERSLIAEMSYRFGFDGSNGVFQWQDEEHLYQGFEMYETFVNEFEAFVKDRCAKIAQEQGQEAVAEAITNMTINDLIGIRAPA